MNGRTNSSGSSVNDLQIPLDPCTNLECVAGNAQVKLTWTDPLNKYATPEGEVAEDPDQLVSVWHHTVVIRKVGSAPVGIDDGIVVVSSEVKNQYQSTAYVDTGLINDTTYYYGVFAINEDGVESEGLVSEGVTPKLGTPLSELAEGTIIKINENGAPVEFYLAKHNYEPDLNGPGRELLVRKDCFHANDARYDDFNRYHDSALDKWLNGTYLNYFSSDLIISIGQTVFEYNTGTHNYINGELTSPIFLLSAREIGDEGPNIGTLLPTADILKICYNEENEADIWWTRSPNSDHTTDVYAVNSSGNLAICHNQWVNAIRPCFTLPADIFIDINLNLVEY